MGQFSRSFHSGIMVPCDFLSRVRLTLSGGVRNMFTVDVYVSVTLSGYVHWYVHMGAIEKRAKGILTNRR